MFPRKNQNLGFSLLELVVIVAILSTLAAVIAPSLSSFYKDSKSEQIVTMIDTLRDACMRYWQDNDCLPVESSTACFTTADNCTFNRRLSLEPTKKDPGNPCETDNLLRTWDGPYIEEPLSSTRHPTGGIIRVSTDFTGKTFTMIINATTENPVAKGVFLELDQISAQMASEVELKMDPVNSATNGRVLYNSSTSVLSILLIEDAF